MPSPGGLILYEADVVAAVAAHLTARGWVEKARAATTAPGVDLLVRAGRFSLAVEAKGAGSSQDHTRRFGRPFTGGQVGDHVAMAVAAALRVVAAGDHTAVIALPDDDQHRRHVATLLPALVKVGVTVLWVSLDGTVRDEGALLPDPRHGSDEMVLLQDGTAEVIEYDADGEVVQRTYGAVGPRGEAHADAQLLAAAAASHSDDWVKVGTWDIRDDLHQPVNTVDALAMALGWGDDRESELRAFMLLPAFRAAPASLRREIRRLLLGPQSKAAPSALELVVLAHRHDPALLGEALLAFPWGDSTPVPPYLGGGWQSYLAANQPGQDTPGALLQSARAWGVPVSVVRRIRAAFRAAGGRIEEPHVPMQTASDYDGIEHVVALADDVEGWVVLESLNGLERPAYGPLPFSSGYSQGLAGKPAWAIDTADSWRVHVDGHPVSTVWGLPPGRSSAPSA